MKRRCDIRRSGSESHRVFAFFETVALALMLTVVACSSDRDARPSFGYTAPPTYVAGSPAPCTSGETSRCTLELGTTGTITSCGAGERTCVDGAWSACALDVNRPLYYVAAPDAQRSGLRVQSLSQSSTECENDPCHPDCQVFEDEPDEPVTSVPGATTVNSTGGTLEESNVPPSFKSKGSLDSRCTSPCTTKSCMEACQFDQHCGKLASGDAGCVGFEKDEQASCVGVDITVPTTCVPRAGFRKVTVCNRGTVGAAPGVLCYAFSGGSPQFPEDAPSLRHAKLVLTTKATLLPGKCETQEVPESVFGNSGIQSLMCNPPGTGSGGYIAETSAGTLLPTAFATQTWLDAENAYAADGSYASAPSLEQTTGSRYPTASSAVSGFSNPERAYLADGATTTASPPASAGTLVKYATTNSASGWTNPARAFTANEADAALRYATAAPALPPLGAVTTTTARYPTSNTGNVCNNGAACAWQTPNNAYAAESPPAPSPSFTYAALSQTGVPDSASIFYGGFNFSDIAANAIIKSFTITVRWKGNNKIALARVQAYKADGSAVGTAVSRTGSGNANPFEETASATSSLSYGQVTLADLVGAKFLKLSAAHSDDSSNNTISVDYVTVAVSYQVPGAPQQSALTLGSFGLSLPTGAVITNLATEVKWKVSAANANVMLGMQPFTNNGSSPLDGETTATATAALTNDTLATHTASSGVLAGLTGATLANGSFGVLLRATRKHTGDGSSNPDVTVSVDYVKVTLSYVLNASSPTATYRQFSFGIPSGATVLGVTSEVNWNVSVANAHVTLGLQPLLGGVALGAELTTGTGVSPPLLGTLASTSSTGKAGVPFTVSDFNDPNFALRVRATRVSGSGSLNDPDTTAMVDHVRARVRYIMNPTQTVDFSGYGFDIPVARDLLRLTAEVKWKVSTANDNVTLGYQAYKDAGLTAVGAEATTSPDSSPPTTATVMTSNIDVTNLTPADLNDPAFALRIRSTRSSGASVNPDHSSLLDYVKLSAFYGTPTGGNLVECNPYNNWSATKLVPDPQPCIDDGSIAYPPWTVTRVFQAECPASKGAAWSAFAYRASAPSDSKIDFRFRAFPSVNGQCSAQPAVTSGNTPSPLATARSSPVDTQVCELEGTSQLCPVDLFEGVMTPGSVGTDCLQMDAVGTPASDNSASPTLFDWTVTFECRDFQ
jgi:hypothetical protein